MLKPICDCGLIDTHTHWVPESFPAYVGSRKGVAWPSMAPADSACQRHVIIQEKIYRTIPTSCFNLGERLERMAEQGVTQQVVSPMPELMSYWLEPDDANALSQYLNDSLAAQVAQHPTQFVALGTVPLQDLDMALRELERVVTKLGMAGVQIGSNINGKPIGHPDFAPFFAAAEQLGAALFVHALRPAGMDRLVGPPALEQVLAFPGEIGLAGASMVTSGRLRDLPKLRIALSHGGGSLPILLARMEHAWSCMPPITKALPSSPSATARQLFVDDLVYDRASVLRLIEVYGPTQVMAGTDYPFVIADADPAGRIDSLGQSVEVVQALREHNALRWLARS